MHTKSSVHWSQSEISKLEQLYPINRFGELTKFFPERTLSGIRTKAVRLKIRKPFKDLKFINLEPSFSLGYIMGVVNGDGCLSYWKEKNGREHHYVRLKVKDKDFRDFFVQQVSNIGGHCNTFLDKRQFYIATVHSKPLHKFLKKFDIKRLLQETKEMKQGFLMGFFDSEGSISKNRKCNSWRIKTVNKLEERIDICKQLLEDFGIKTYKHKKYGSSFNPDGIYHTLEIATEGSVNFFINVGFSINRKQEKLLQLMKHIEGGYYSH